MPSYKLDLREGSPTWFVKPRDKSEANTIKQSLDNAGIFQKDPHEYATNMTRQWKTKLLPPLIKIVMS